jgi:hypothetical protein
MGVSLCWLHGRALVVGVLVAVLATLLVFAIIAGAGLSAGTARAASRHHQRHHAVRHAQVRRTAQSDPVTSSDGDNVQSGDQTAPDAPGETSGEHESSVESEQLQPGEPANGHQDAPGQDVNHECTDNCVE